MSPSRRLLQIGTGLAGTIGAALLIQSAFIGAELARSALLTLLTGSCALAGCLLLINRRLLDAVGRVPRVRLDLGCGALAASSAAGFVVLTGNADARTAPLAVACFLLVWLMGSAISALEQLGTPLPLGASISAAIAALAAAAPLWLAPLAEISRSTTLVNAALAVSPLTLLAVLADFDYLRTGWFYQHSALGALRYAYPPGWMLIAIYAGLAAVLWAWASRRQRMRHNETVSTTKA